MENKTNLRKIIETLHKQTEKIGRRQQELQEDADLLQDVIGRLNLHSCSVKNYRTSGWTDKEEIMKAYQKAREDRDEYKFQLDVCKTNIKELKEELDAARLNQTQHNISVVADLSYLNGRKSCLPTYKKEPGDSSNKNDAGGGLNALHSVSEETYKRELNYLHKTNEELFEENRKLKSELLSQKALREKLNDYEGEITKLRKITEEKQAKMMDMQIQFDETLKNCKRDFTFRISTMDGKIQELEEVRDSLNIDLGAAHEEIRSLKLSLKLVEEASEHSTSIVFPPKAVRNPKQKEKETSRGKEEPLNVTTRREKRCRLQSIENIIEHDHSTFTSLSEQSITEEHQVTVDEVDVILGANRGTKRVQRAGKGSKKEPTVPQKQDAKKMKSSDLKTSDPLQDIKNESVDTSSSNTRKGTRGRAVVNPRRKATYCKDAVVTNSKQSKKLMDKLETDENVDPYPPEYSSSPLNGTMGSIKLTEDKSRLPMKVLEKVHDDNNKRTTRRRNK